MVLSAHQVAHHPSQAVLIASSHVSADAINIAGIEILSSNPNLSGPRGRACSIGAHLHDCRRHVLHIMDGHFRFRTGDPLDQFHRIVAHHTAGTEYFHLSLSLSAPDHIANPRVSAPPLRDSRPPYRDQNRLNLEASLESSVFLRPPLSVG